MAIFTAVRNKKQTAGTMMGVLKYVTQACKTMLDDQWMVTGHNCVARASYLEMMTTKQQFRKTDGRQFYHFVQSFPAEDGLTPQQVNAIGVEFAQKQFPDFEVVVANSVSKFSFRNVSSWRLLSRHRRPSGQTKVICFRVSVQITS